jgi:hypothetical protein
LGNAINATLGTGSVNATIVDNDTQADSITPANLTVQDVVANENEHTATVYVELDRAVSHAFSVDYATRDISAQAGSDYGPLSGTLGFAAGDTLQTIVLDITQDTLDETTEQFQLLLSNPTSSHVNLSDATATVTIEDGQSQEYPDDNGSPEANLNTITFSEYSLNTENPSYHFSDNSVDVIGMIVRDTAQPESPVVAANTNFLGPVYINFQNPVEYVSFDAGYFNNLGSTTIEYIGPGGQVLHSETNTGFGVINYEYRNTAGISSIHVVNTGHDESGFSVDSVSFGSAVTTDAPVSTINMKSQAVEQPEGDTGTTLFTFTVERTGDLSQPAESGWAVTTTDLNSVTADDFVGDEYPTGVVSFGANQSQQTITIEVQGDITEELDEHFVVNLLAPSRGTTIGVGSATATILNDDTGGVIPDTPITIGPDDDTFIVQQGIVSRGAGDDTYILSELTTLADAKVTISDTTGNNRISLYEGLTIKHFAVTTNALKLTLGNGSEVTVLNASGYQYSVTPSPLSITETADLMGFDQFVSSVLGIAGGAPATGITEGTDVVLGNGGNWSPETAPVREAGDDIFVAQRGIVSRGGGDDTYVVTDKLIADQDSVTISDSIGDNTIALADGLQISSFAVANNALKLSLANGEEVTILNAGSYQFMTGGNLFAGTPGAVYGYADFVQDVLGVAGGLPSVGIIEGGGVTIETATIVELPVAAKQMVQATAGNEIFTLDVTAAQRTETDTQLVLNGFDTVNDVLQIDWDGERGSYSLAEAANMTSISAEYDPFEHTQVITFGMDANADPVSLTLQGVSDPSLVSVVLV